MDRRALLLLLALTGCGGDSGRDRCDRGEIEIGREIYPLGIGCQSEEFRLRVPEAGWVAVTGHNPSPDGTTWCVLGFPGQVKVIFRGELEAACVWLEAGRHLVTALWTPGVVDAWWRLD